MKQTIIRILGFTVGITSTLFMILVFVSEGLAGRGMLFSEPNLLIARAELIACVSGLVALAWTAYNSMSATIKGGIEL